MTVPAATGKQPSLMTSHNGIRAPVPGVGPARDRVYSVPIVRQLPARYQAWIELPDALTAAISRVHGQRVHVEPSYEGTTRAAAWEAALLRGWRSDNQWRRVYCREVALTLPGRTVVLARSLTAINDPSVAALRSLQRRPLAELLFHDPLWQRAAPPVALRWHRGADVIIGRASLWHRSGRRPGRLLVEEYFLDALFAPLESGARFGA